MSTDTRPLCPRCLHDRDSHDPQLGCLIPWCWCVSTETSWQKRFTRWLTRSAVASTLGGIIVAAGVIAVAVALYTLLPVAVGREPRPIAPAVAPSDRPLQTARQEKPLPLNNCQTCGQNAWLCDKCGDRINRAQPLYLPPPYGSLSAADPKVLCDDCHDAFIVWSWEWLGLDTAPVQEHIRQRRAIHDKAERN